MNGIEWIAVGTAIVGLLAAIADLVGKVRKQWSFLEKIFGQGRLAALTVLLCAAVAGLGAFITIRHYRDQLGDVHREKARLVTMYEEQKKDTRIASERMLTQFELLSEDFDRLQKKGAKSPAARITLFESKDFAGRRLSLTAEDCPDLRDYFFNDRVGSIKLQGVKRIIVFENVGYTGESLPVSGDTASLGIWADKISSFRVVK